MDVVIRSSQGEAEITIAPVDLDASLGEIVEDVTNRPAPRVIYVDGHAVPADTSLGTSGVLVGSVLDVGNEPDQPPRNAVAELVQHAGHGAGRRIWLAPGRYRIGPGRRVNGHELAESAVDDTRLELLVDGDGSVAMRVDPDEEFRPWPDRLLSLGGRVFEARPRDPKRDSTVRRLPAVDVDGSVAFNRPPRVPPPPDPPALVVPDRGAGATRVLHVPWIAVVLPLAVAAVAAVVTGDPRALLIALLTPVLAVIRTSTARPDPDGRAVSTDSPAEAEFRVAAADRRSDDERRARALHPSLAEALEQARVASPDLWQRRPSDRDAFQIAVGMADRPWEPKLETGTRSIDNAADIVAATGGMRAVPVIADLASERGIGIVAVPETAAALARGVVLEAAVVHGPADLDVVILTTPDRLEMWEWAKWLPHVRRGSGPAVLSDIEQISAWADAVRDEWERPSRPVAPSHVTLVVADEPDLWRDRTAPLRRLFGDASLPLRFVALAPSTSDVPAVCTTVIVEGPDDRMAVEYVLSRERVEQVAAYLVDTVLATEVARSLAPLDDPDVPTSPDSVALPAVVPILDLLALTEVSPSAIRDRWQAGAPPAPTRAPLGRGEHGDVVVDLVADGPHAVIAGATGSGKSELLLTLVTGLATSHSPDEVNVLIVDGSGGTTFDGCTAFPHTVGIVRHIDEHTAGRLLRSLRAELRHREAVLRTAGSTSFDDHRRHAGIPSMPRLVLVVDEFAPMAVELPDVVPALVEVAERGRNLGIHVVLATERPAEAVDDKIKAIARLRIALRVQESRESLDVIGTPDAATISSRAPGRAIGRFADGDLVEFQVAYSSGATEHAGGHRFGVRPFVLGRSLSSQERRLDRHLRAGARDGGRGEGAGVGGRQSDLLRLVDAAAGAARELGQHRQRQPFIDPLPDRLPLAEFFESHPGDGVPFGLIDLPDEQRQAPAWWQPGTLGSLIAYGIGGAGTSSFLVTLGLGAAQRFSADDLHLYAIDADTDLLGPLEQLPHCGAVVRLDETDRLTRLVRFLHDELDRRALVSSAGGRTTVLHAEPSIVVLIDNVGSLRQLLDDLRDVEEVWRDLERVVREGGPLGICTVLTAKHERALPASLTSELDARLVMRLSDPFAYATFGFRPADLPAFVPGRALRVDDGVEIQLVAPPDDLAAAVAELAEPAVERPPRRIDPVPTAVTVADLVDAARGSPDGLVAAVGVSTTTAEPIELVVRRGAAVLVTGAPRSGKSSVLVAIAEAARRVDPSMPVFAVGPRGGPLMATDAVTDRPDTPAAVADWVGRIADASGPRLVLVDDADRLAGPSFDRLASLVAGDLMLVVAAPAHELRSPSHWTRPLQPVGNAALIGPAPGDVEIVDAELDLDAHRFAPRTGLVVVDGAIEHVLFASVEHPDVADVGVGRGLGATPEAGIR